MDINTTEEMLEHGLLLFGIERGEIDGLTLLIIGIMMGHGILVYLYFKIKCSAITCRKMEESMIVSSKIGKDIAKIEKSLLEISIKGEAEHSTIGANVDKIDSIVSDLKFSVFQLHGIMLGGASSSVSRRSIRHDDE